jgi:hypothetical protein
MKVSWYIGCKDDDDKLERAALIHASHQALTILRTILEKNVEEISNTAESQKNYELAAWPYLQADRIGAIRALKNVIELLPTKDLK